MSHQRLDDCFKRFKEYTSSKDLTRLNQLKTAFMVQVNVEFTEGQGLIGKYITDTKYSFNRLGSFLDDCKLGQWSYAQEYFDEAKKEYTLFVEVLEKSIKNMENMRKLDQRGDTTNNYTQNVAKQSRDINRSPEPRATVYSPVRDQSSIPTPRENHQVPTTYKGDQVSSASTATTTSPNQAQYEHGHQYLKNNKVSGRTITRGPENVSLEEKDLTPPNYDTGRRLETSQKEDYKQPIKPTKDSPAASYNDQYISKEANKKKEGKYEYGDASADIYRSEKASILLRDNNPNIADLSDSNRPTKLAERFSELYSNEYTDAFEEFARDHSDEGVTEYNLLRVVRYAYTHCQDWNHKVEDELRMKQVRIVKSEDEKIIDREKHQAEKKRKVEKNKEVVVQMFMKNNVPWLLNDMYAATKCVKTENAESKYKRYANKCVEIVWWMCVQNPPVHLEFLQDRFKGQSSEQIFDSSLYRSYTKSGQYVDFCVWPLLRLNKDGPILSKGIAQGKNK